MFIGKTNDITEKMVEEISQVYPVQMVEYNKNLPELLENYDGQPQFIFVNLLDIGNADEIPSLLRKHFKDSKIVAIHCYQADALIASTLEKGYDHYVSLLSFAENISKFLWQVNAKK